MCKILAMPKNTEFSDVHKRQIFHWIGRGVDSDLRARRLSPADARERYLNYLKDDLRHGLPIKKPQVPETLVCDGMTIPLDLPMACFTEWSLSESKPHSSRYGRMALGFSKAWIIKHGGQPVTYFSHQQKGLFLKTLVGLHQFVVDLKLNHADTISAKDLDSASQRLLYLLHFAKPFAAPQEKRSPLKEFVALKAKLLEEKEGLSRRLKPVGEKRPRPASRNYGRTLEFLEEREWRIVRHDKTYFITDRAGVFDSRIAFMPGSELFTLVLPDHETVKMAWQDSFIRNRLLKASVPVAVLSFQDLGTF